MWFEPFHECHDLLDRPGGPEQNLDAVRYERRGIFIGNDSPAEQNNISGFLFLEKSEDVPKERIVRA
jgi:hypothetical protein